MAKTLTKKELREPDAFQTLAAKSARFIEDYLAFILAAVGVLIIGLVGWFGWMAYQSSQESKAADAIYQYEAAVFTTLSNVKGSEIPSLSEYIGALKAHENTKVALTSALAVVGKLRETEGTEALQKEVLNAVTHVPAKSNVLFGLSRMTYGQVANENNEFDEAHGYFKSIVDEPKQKPLHASALIQMGGVAEKKGDLTSARSFYNRVVQEFPDTEAQKMAEKLIIHLDLLTDSQTQGS